MLQEAQVESARVPRHLTLRMRCDFSASECRRSRSPMLASRLSRLVGRLVNQSAGNAYSSKFSSAAHQLQTSNPRWSKTKLLLAGAPVAVAAWIIASEDSQRSFRIAYQIPVRVMRDAVTITSIAADYKLSLQGKEGEERQNALNACHSRGAWQLQKLCFANGGIYIKLGQHVAQLDHLLPPEYVHTMRDHMLDKCPVSSPAEVAKTLREDLGAGPEELFHSFEETPIASASLAQVHRAVSHDGQQLAVKVQHAGLRDTCQADTLVVEVFVRVLRWAFPDFNYQWLIDEVKESLPQELDFELEAANSLRCQAHLLHPRSKVRGQVVVPRIQQGMVSKRVLAMEFVEGIKVTDRQRLQEAGLRPQAIAQLVSQTFNEMIFMHGYVHCDPHAANLFVRVHKGRPQLILLDHGLYRSITDQFRHDYACLWQALIFSDVEGIKKYSAAMNAGDMYPLFAGMLTQRPWDQVTRRSWDHLNLKRDDAEREMIMSTSQQFAKEISSLLQRVPRALLLLLKTNDCLRAIDVALGQPVNTFVITARECTRALADMKRKEGKGLRSQLSASLMEWHVEWRVTLLKAATWLAYLKAYWSGPSQQQKALA